jgi:hypothetical protein
VRPSADWRKALRLACWNAVGFRGRKLELDPYLSKHGFDICLLKETQFASARTLRFAKYVCQRKYLPSHVGGTAVHLRDRINNYPVPVSELQGLEAAGSGGCCHTPSVGDQTSEACVGVSLANKTLDRVAPDRVSERRISGLNYGCSQSKAYGLQF